MANKKELIEDINDARKLLEATKDNALLREKLITYIKNLITELIPKLP